MGRDDEREVLASAEEGHGRVDMMFDAKEEAELRIKDVSMRSEVIRAASCVMLIEVVFRTQADGSDCSEKQSQAKHQASCDCRKGNPYRPCRFSEASLCSKTDAVRGSLC